LYFTELYEDTGANGPTAPGARIFRVRNINQPQPGDYDNDGNVDNDDYLVWRSTFGSSVALAADGNGNGVVDTADYVVWRNIFSAAVASSSSLNKSQPVAAAAVHVPTEPLLPNSTGKKEQLGALIVSPTDGDDTSLTRIRTTAARRTEFGAARDLALLALLYEGRSVGTTTDVAVERPDGRTYPDNDPIESIDELFGALALL
jgi:hypothetical protein